MTAYRYPGNPIITPEDVPPSRPDFRVRCAFNAGVTRHGGDVLLLLRVAEQAASDDPDIVRVPYIDENTNALVIRDFRRDDPDADFSDSRFVRTPDRIYLSSISHLRVATSHDGLHFAVEETPALFPSNVYEMYGVEDPRITTIGDTYYVNYSAISPLTGVTTCLATTQDFKGFRRHGVIFTPDNKDVAIFPERIGGKYYALHRPAAAEYDLKDVWLAESPDLVCWGNHRSLMQTRRGMWDDGRIGCSAVPFLIDEGWLEIYHGASKDDRYCLGAALLDRDEPWKVLARTTQPILQPEADYELHGFFGNVVFNCGVLCEEGVLRPGRMVKIYYGAADTVMAYAEVPLADILNDLR